MAAEVDLWFSAAVQSRTPLAIVLRSDLLDELRADLALDQALLDRAWVVLKGVHAGAPPILRLEEELTWLGLSTGAGATDPACRPIRSASSGSKGDSPTREAATWMVTMP